MGPVVRVPELCPSRCVSPVAGATRRNGGKGIVELVGARAQVGHHSRIGPEQPDVSAVGQAGSASR